MIGKTIFIGQPAKLSLAMGQMVLERKEVEPFKTSIPIEDLGLLVLEHPQISLTHGLLASLMSHKVAVVTCDAQYMPCGLLLPLEGHSVHTERMHIQLKSSKPLNKQLWQQTVQAKIQNQAALLCQKSLISKPLEMLVTKVKSGDPTNCEAQAAAYYWDHLMGPEFLRLQEPQYPNGALNYGYAIVRALMARAIVATGLLPSMGIFHHNKYNAFCLADDLMEPYRPFVDQVVLNQCVPPETDIDIGLSMAQKKVLLALPQLTLQMEGLQRPLFHAVGLTAHSLFKCYAGEKRKLSFPHFPITTDYAPE